MATADTYVPPPTACERLAELCAQAGGTVTPRAGSGAGRLDYAVPAQATAEIQEFLRRTATADWDGEIVAQLPGGRVFGSGHVLSPDGRAIARDVSLDFGKPFAAHWLLGYQKIRPPARLDGTVAVVATTLGAGYAHWLLEEWPRRLALGPGAGGAEKIIAHAAPLFAREAQALTGWAGEVIEPGRYSHFGCEQLVVPSLPGPEGRPTAAMVERVNGAVAPLHDLAVSPWGERIYVTRDRARRRRVANEAEVWAQLEPRGFVKLRAEELTWAEQINAFRQAKVVVGPHGAGLANLIFCRPGTRVVELFNRAYVNGLYWRLAALRGLDYRPVVAPGAEPLAQVTARNRDDLVADVAELMRAVG